MLTNKAIQAVSIFFLKLLYKIPVKAKANGEFNYLRLETHNHIIKCNKFGDQQLSILSFFYTNALARAVPSCTGSNSIVPR